MPYNSNVVACLLLSACVYCFSSRITLEAAKLEEWKMNGKVTYHQQVSYCGKPRCHKCRDGVGHGPYWYAYTTVNGRTTRTYIETASSRLDRSVYSLRQVLEPALNRPASSRLLRMEREGPALADQAHIWVDADEFEHLLNQARATNDAGEREQLLEEASALYSGDFLPEERYSDWIRTRREALQRSWMGSQLELADLRIAREALVIAIEPLDRLLATDPANEAAVQRLIISLARLDRRG